MAYVNVRDERGCEILKYRHQVISAAKKEETEFILF